MQRPCPHPGPQVGQRLGYVPWRGTCLEGTCLTCDVEMSIAGGFAQLVSNDALVDASMLRSHGGEHQSMDIPVWGWGGT